jgi:hypothetical protein
MPFDDPLDFVRQQQKRTFEYAAQVARVRRAFLIIWKEGGWPINELEAAITRFNADPSSTEPWRMHSHLQCRVGDKVYALKQGKGPKTIFAVGEVASTPFQKEWDGRAHWMVDVKFDQFVE